jgi:hypothetical protein
MLEGPIGGYEDDVRGSRDRIENAAPAGLFKSSTTLRFPRLGLEVKTVCAGIVLLVRSGNIATKRGSSTVDDFRTKVGQL